MYLSVFGVAMGWANPREFICMWIAFWEEVTVGKKESGPSKLRYGAVGRKRMLEVAWYTVRAQ